MMKYVIELQVFWFLTLDFVSKVIGLSGFYAFLLKSNPCLILIYFGLVKVFSSFGSWPLYSSIIIFFVVLLVVNGFLNYLRSSDALNLIILLVETMKKYVVSIWYRWALSVLDLFFTDFGLFLFYAFIFKSIPLGHGFWIATKLLMVGYIVKGQLHGYLILLSWLTLGFWLMVCIFGLKWCLGLPSIMCFRTAALLDDLEL